MAGKMNYLSEEELGREACELIRKVDREFGEKVKTAVRTRCRQLYGYMFKAGLLSTLAYAYAGAEGERLVQRSFEWLSGKGPAPSAEKEENLGYALYAAFLCRMLSLAEAKIGNADLESVVRELTSTPEDALVAEELALKFAKWLKLFAEAMLSEQR